MYAHLNADGSVLTNPHCKAQSLSVVDRLLAPPTVIKFIEFAFGGPLPNGSQPDVERLNNDEIHFFQQDQNFPPGSDEESIMTRVMIRIGSDKDSSRLCLVGRNIQSLKSRLWEGIIPLSEQSWQEKGLDQPQNFEVACQHLSAVIAVFEYLNTRQVRLFLRGTFNYIYDVWALLDTVLNERRAEKNQPRISVAALWTMYIKAYFEMMTERAHRWVILHAISLRAPLLRTLSEHRRSQEGDGSPDSLQWQITDSLQVVAEIISSADFTIMIPMNDYKGYPLPRRNDSTSLHAPDLGTRAKAYHQRLRLLTRENMVNGIVGRASHSHSHSGESYCESGRYQIEAQNTLRREIRGAPIEPVPREPWIVSCASRMESGTNTETEKKYGLAVYRLTYGQPESEWTAFVDKVEAHVSDWGKGQTGSSIIKEQLKLHWLDGKDLGIPEGDIEAAKRHFKVFIEDSEIWSGLQKNAFLVADSASFASYTTDSYSPAISQLNPGDFAGFILAVDPEFDEEEGLERPDESPGYSGQMRILGSLVWGDLYSRLISQSAYLEDLWPLAIEHPNLVYVGPTVPMQRVAWEGYIGLRWALLRAVVDHFKPSLGIPVSAPASSTETIPFRSPSQPGVSESLPSPSAPVSSPEPAPFEQHDGPGNTQSSPTSPPSSLPTANTPTDAALRAWMLRDFQGYMRSRGQTVPAAMAEELLRIRPNERPDSARIHQWVAVEEELQAQRRRNGEEDEATGDYQPQCPSQ